MANNAPENVVVIMTDQQRADVSAREGFQLDTTPFLDSLASDGVWFDRAYSSNPICCPARTSFLTGRYPSVTGVRDNKIRSDTCQPVRYETDIFQALESQGFTTGLVGKDHTYLEPDRVDHYVPFAHRQGVTRNAEQKEFDEWMQDLPPHNFSLEPTPFPLECQLAHRTVSEAQQWIDSVNDDPFFLWLSIPEPHTPYQVPEPYFSMFPPDELPPVEADAEMLEKKGFKYEWARSLAEERTDQYPEEDIEYDEVLPRLRSNYFGLMRMVDDQIERFMQFLESRDLAEDTLVVFVSDHGDLVGEYGLMRKGTGIPEELVRVPMFFVGPNIEPTEGPHSAHVSLVDIMPTICEAVGGSIPTGVQGRSLWPLLTGEDYPEEEFASAYAEAGHGGLAYDWSDDPTVENNHRGPGPTLSEGNTYTQSGVMCMLRKDDHKLVVDAQGNSSLYDLSEEDSEWNDVWNDPDYADVRSDLLQDLLKRRLRVQDPLPQAPRYHVKSDPHNYWEGS
jgi:arylsulfatase A-like enzyme